MCMVLYLFSWFTATGVCVQVEVQLPAQQVCINVYHDTLHVTCGLIADSLTKQPLQTLGNHLYLYMSVSLKNFLVALYYEYYIQ